MHRDFQLQAYVLRSWLVACITVGCAGPSIQEREGVVGGIDGDETREIPEELLLDIGIGVFESTDPMLDGDDTSVFRNAEVVRAERNYLPYVIGKYLQGTGTWGAVRVVPRPAIVDVTVTASITHSDGETLAFRAQATDARGIQWFERDYRATAEPGAYDGDQAINDPFVDAFATLAADLAVSLRTLTLDDLARIRSVTELAFARSITPEAFDRHVTPKPEGGFELHRLPADDDPLLARVRQIRDREHLLIDQVNDYYEDFTTNIQRPYDVWRREAFHSRRAQRELSMRADAQMLLGSTRVIAGLASMESGMPGRERVDHVTRGLRLIRRAELSEDLIHDAFESMREVGRSTEANLLPHTTALENRTTRLQQVVESRYDALRVILNRLYREEFGPPTGASEKAPPSGKERRGAPTEVENPTQAQAAVVASPRSASARRSPVDSRMADAKEEIRSGKVDEALDTLNDLLADADEELDALASARIHTLMALGHFAQADDREAMAAFNRVVRSACATVCSDETLSGTGVASRRPYRAPRPAVFEFIMAVQSDIRDGDIDTAIRSLGGSVDGSDSGSKLKPIRTPRVSQLRPVERALAYQVLARAYVAKKDYEAAIAVYERILELGTRAPPWHGEISNRILAQIHFVRMEYEKSLTYQRAWLRTSDWAGEACPMVCRPIL